MLGAKALVRLLLVLAGCALVANCSETKFASMAVKELQPSNAPAPSKGTYKVGDPYQINGVWYYPAEDYTYDETGIASWYGPDFHGKYTANGETYDMNDVTAAHRTLPMPSIVRVTNLENGRSLIVRINDRGPYAHNRIIDLSRRSAQLLGVIDKGTARVRVQIMADESRAIAMQMKNGGSTEVASLAPAPRVAVQTETLPAPGSSEKPKPVAAASSPPKPAPTVVAANDPPSPYDGAVLAKQQVKQEPVKATQIFIQAGAFARYDNAHRLSAILSPLGPTTVSQVDTKSGTLFRVRIGPIGSVSDADALLERVIGAGHPDARIVVD